MKPGLLHVSTAIHHEGTAGGHCGDNTRNFPGVFVCSVHEGGDFRNVKIASSELHNLYVLFENRLTGKLKLLQVKLWHAFSRHKV